MKNPVSWSFRKLKQFNDLVWHTPLSVVSRRKMLLVKQMRILVIAGRGLINNKVNLEASALTFYSLLAVVPLAAIAFAIAKGFGLDQNLEEQIVKNFETQKEVLNWLLTNARNALDATKGGYMAGVGVLVLLWSVMSLLDSIERSFNNIWEIKTSRPWFRKFTDYLTIMLIAPVFVILSGSITVLINTRLTDFITDSAILEWAKPIVSFLVKLIPFVLTWLVLTIIFVVMPNTKVKFRSALIAGIVSGTLLQLLQWLYIDLQFGITRLNSIYGSFAAIPLFIVWMQMSWLVVLLGAELSFANQNVSRYEFESESQNISLHNKKALTLMILGRIIRHFENGLPPLSAEVISSEIATPVRIVRDILQDLVNTGLVSVVVRDDSKERLYQPAKNTGNITVSSVLSLIDKKGVEQQSLLKNKEFEKVNNILAKLDKQLSKSKANILLKDL